MSLRFGILTVSDRSSRGEREDRSGPELEGMVAGQGWQVLKRTVLPDEQGAIARLMRDWADSGEIDVLLATGGTGFAPRDVTPEATREVVERMAPGIAAAMRIASMEVTPFAMLSRGIAGIRRNTLIVNLSGSPKAAREQFEVIIPVLPHAVQLLKGDPAAEASHASLNRPERSGRD